MACEVDKKRKCFTYIWKLENGNYWWKRDESIESPAFTVDEINGTNWKLQLLFYFDRYLDSDLYLKRQADNKDTGNVEIDIELAFLSADGTVLHSFEYTNAVIQVDEQTGSHKFPSRYDVFFARRSEYLSQDTLTVRCRMWKSVGEISKDVQCIARTRIAVEKRSSLLNIENFSTLQPDEKQPFEIKSLETGEQLMHLQIFMTYKQILDEMISLRIIPNFKNIKTATLKLSIIDAFKNANKCFVGEFYDPDLHDGEEFTLFYTKTDLMEMKRKYLPNDILSFLCECCFCFGTIVEEIEFGSSNCPVIENIEQDGHCLDKANELPVLIGILINDLKSMLNNSMFSDVKLKTRSKTYPAHKLILGVRSPVFKAMFSNDMKEKITDCVNIEDLSDDTVFHMLRYLYSADVEELEWSRATELYEAADKYQILNLKDICSSFLKTNLHPNNACEVLVLADLHQDEDLKSFVQGFTLRHGKEIINSEDWMQLMETNLKLAAETMCLQFKE